jgi:SlyX protein
VDNEKIHEQIADLQTRLAFQEDSIEHLNKTVAQQDQSIALLRAQIQYLYDQVKHIARQRDDAGHDELPPHY